MWAVEPYDDDEDTGARTDITQQTNICLDIHLQTSVAPFNQTCLSRLLPAKRLSFLSLLIVGDVKRCMMYGSGDDSQVMTGTIFLLMDSNLCLKFMKRVNSGCIKLGSQELMENIQCATMHDFAFYINNCCYN
jgi:hypothetical protein